MNISDLREAMGLTTAQVAEELGVPRADVEDCEESGSTYLLRPFIAAFPINPEILVDEEIDPFLDTFVQNDLKDRAKEWREENGLTLEREAEVLGMSAEQLARMEENGRVTKALGIKIEKMIGMNRKWLMYGDGRNKGTCLIAPAAEKMPKRGRPNTSGNEPRKIKPNRDLGQKIKAARKAAGMSREEMAKELNLSVSRVDQMESGYIRESRANEVLSQLQSGDIAKDWGLRIREARKNSGLKLKDAADAVGLAPGTLAAMECGHVSAKRAEELIAQLKKAEAPAKTKEPDFDKEMGAEIREARKAKGMTIKELATILHVPQSTVSRMELGYVSREKAEEAIARINGKPRRETKNRRVKTSTKVLVGRELKELRKKVGLSQKELGDLVGYPQSRISLIEKGEVDDRTAADIRRVIEREAQRRDLMLDIE